MSENKINSTPEDEALWKFDAENNVRPFREVAEELALQFGYCQEAVDAIAHALEDSFVLGTKRGKL